MRPVSVVRRSAGRRVAWWSVLVLVVAGLGLVGAPAASAAGPVADLSVTSPYWLVAGVPFDVTVTARDAAGQVATSYRGTVRLTSDDPRRPVLPAAYTFTSADQGRHTFHGVELHTAGLGRIDVRDTRTAAFADVRIMHVSPGPLSVLAVSAPYQVVAGTAFSVMVQAKDAWLNRVVSYRGTVRFTSSDPLVRALPADYTFTKADQGRHVFAGVTLVSPGSRTVVAQDVATPAVLGSDGVRVLNAAARVVGVVETAPIVPYPYGPPEYPEPVVGATVTVYDALTARVLGQAVSAADGTFSIGNLPVGGVKIRAAAAGMVTQYIGGDTFAGATTFVLAAGATTYLGVTGRLTLPPAHAAVVGSVGLEYGERGQPYTVTVYDADTGEVLASAQSQENPWLGDVYVIPVVPAGDVTIGATAEGFLPGFANGKATWETADVITLVAGQALVEPPLFLPRDPAFAAGLQGQVLSGLDPVVHDATVSVYDEDNQVVASVQADGEGYYSFAGLPPIAIRVGATATGFLEGFANDKDTLATADWFQLVAGQTLVQRWEPTDFGPYLDLNPVPAS